MKTKFVYFEFKKILTGKISTKVEINSPIFCPVRSPVNESLPGIERVSLKNESTVDFNENKNNKFNRVRTRAIFVVQDVEGIDCENDELEQDL